MKGRILIVDDESAFAQVVADHLSDLGYETVAESSAESALHRALQQEFDVALLDVRMPGMDGLALLPRLKETQRALEVIMITGHSTVEDAVRAIKLGALDYVSKPAPLTEIDAVIEKALEVHALRMETFQWREGAGRAGLSSELIGQSPAMTTVLAQISQVAATDSTVLIEGETGTGKEVVGRAIHRLSARAGKPFVVVDCASLQPAVIESELFGHEKGAFTGAIARKPGLIEVASGGTLFIDEVVEMSLECQSRFLRVLETGELRHVGGTQMFRTDLRIVAASRLPLEQQVRLGKFRDDLFYRLNIYRLMLPPLSERREDIPELAEHFLQRHAHGRVGLRLDSVAVAKLQSYAWPGNVRELANVIERAVITCRDGVVRAEDILIQPTALTTHRVTKLDQMEREAIAKTLEETGGNKRAAARLLGISLRNLYRKLDRYGLSHQPETP